MVVTDIPLADILPPRLQPRLSEDDPGIKELASSIKRHGLLAPLTVTPDEKQWRLLAGNRRLQALQRIGASTAPCVIVDPDLVPGDEITIVENIIRKNLSPVEEAYAFALYLERTGITQEQLADQLGKERTYVTRRLMLTDLDDNTLGAVEEGIINLSQALLLRRVPNPEIRLMFIEHAHTYGANVRVMEMWVLNYEKEQARAQAQEQRNATLAEVEPPRQILMACDRCGASTPYESLRPAYLCPACKRLVAQERLVKEQAK